MVAKSPSGAVQSFPFVLQQKLFDNYFLRYNMKFDGEIENCCIGATSLNDILKPVKNKSSWKWPVRKTI